jgi:hypothetical protein
VEKVETPGAVIYSIVIDNRAAQVSALDLLLLRNPSHRAIVHIRCFAHMADLAIAQRRERMILSDIFEQVGIPSLHLQKRASKAIVGKRRPSMVSTR